MSFVGRRTLACLAGTIVLGSGLTPATEPPVAEANDNRTSAGTWHGDTLVLQLVAQEARWYIHEEKDGAFQVPAFAEEGKAPSIPGPLIRVRAGTPLRVTVRNALADSIAVHGLNGRAQTGRDSVIIAPGEAVERRFIADREGTYYYWSKLLHMPGLAMLFPVGIGQLAGAMIVDPPGDAPIPPDRILVIGAHLDQPVPPGRDAHGIIQRDFVVFNGKSWPHTEHMEYALGDTVRWRFINTSIPPHSLHLHGFYYRVVRRGSNAADSVLPASPPYMAVTESLLSGGTMMIEWVPDRPGGWIFHCHMTQHATLHAPIDRPDIMEPMHHPHGDDDRHALTGMAGLVIGTMVTGPAPSHEPRAGERRLRLFVNTDSAAGDVERRFSYVQQRDANEPAPDSLESGPTVLVLRKGEPTVIEVVNRSGETTAVHWHGIELDSYYDGVAGFGGTPGRLTPAIRSGASFEARMTPPRAGTFMLHTHFDELRQQFGGLVGALIVLDRDEEWDPARERVVLVADGPEAAITINGSTEPQPLEMRVGQTYRLRIANITVDRPLATFYLMRDSTTMATWRPVAKDGWTLTGERATPRDAWQLIGIGETADFEVTPDAPGELTLEMRPGSPFLAGRPDRSSPLLNALHIRVLPR